MNSEEVDRLHGNYRAACRAFATADKVLDTLLADLIAVARAVGVHEPSYDWEIKMPSKRGFNWTDPEWTRVPAREAVVAATGNWIAARQAVRDAYAALPEGERAEAKKPPSGAGL